MRALRFVVGLGIVITGPAVLSAQGPAEAGAAAPTAIANSVDALPPLTVTGKIRFQTLSLIKPVSLASTAFSAGISQWRDVPHAWGQGSEGYAKRFASAEAFGAAHNTIALGFDLALHLDPRYRRRPQASASARVWNAVGQTFIAHRDAGGSMVNVPEIAGSFGAGFVSNTWQPANYGKVSDAITHGLLTLAFHSAKNVAHEFLPDLMQRFRHGKPGNGKRSSVDDNQPHR